MRDGGLGLWVWAVGVGVGQRKGKEMGMGMGWGCIRIVGWDEISWLMIVASLRG